MNFEKDCLPTCPTSRDAVTIWREGRHAMWRLGSAAGLGKRNLKPLSNRDFFEHDYS